MRPGLRLYHTRLKRSMTVSDLAIAAGCSRMTIKNIEMFDHCPTKGAVATRIANALDCHPSDIWPALAEEKAS